MSLIHTFSGNPLDRGDAQRRDPEWLAAATAHPDSRYLPFSKLNVLLEGDEPALGWINTPDIAPLNISDPPIFLGIKDDIVTCVEVNTWNSGLMAFGSSRHPKWNCANLGLSLA